MGRSVNKNIERMQQRAYAKMGIPDNPLKVAWYFEKWYEKLILVEMLILSVWKLFEVLFL